MRFLVEDSIRSLFPEVMFGIVVVRGIDNTRAAQECAERLAQAASDATTRLGDADLASHPAVAPWREAYRSFGVKPSKYRSSIESLLRSARTGSVRSVSPLVDLYNSVSLGYLLPCGGEDLGRIHGDIRLTRANGTEEFVPLGSEQAQPPQSGEVIYRDDTGVICRCWNWREAERTKLTPGTKDAFLCIEALTPADGEQLRTASQELAVLVRELLGGSAETHVVDSGVRAVPLA